MNTLLNIPRRILGIPYFICGVIVYIVYALIVNILFPNWANENNCRTLSFEKIYRWAFDDDICALHIFSIGMLISFTFPFFASPTIINITIWYCSIFCCTWYLAVKKFFGD